MALAKTKEQLLNDNVTFMKDALTRLGIRDLGPESEPGKFQRLIEQRMREGQEKFTETITVSRPAQKDEMVLAFKIEKNKENLYVMKGYQATLTGEGLTPRSNFFNSYQMTGYKIDQARNLLMGNAVLNTVKIDNARIQKYTRLDFNRLTPTGKFREVNTWDVREFDLLKLLSLAKVQASQDEKEQMILRLNNGENVPVLLQSGERGTITTYPENKSLTFIDTNNQRRDIELEKTEWKVQQSQSNRGQTTGNEATGKPDGGTTRKTVQKKEGTVKKPRGQRI
jgi:hypothetical protein